MVNVGDKSETRAFNGKGDLFHAEAVRNVPQGVREDFVFCSDLKGRQEQSVFWSLLSPDQNGIHPPVESSLSLSFSSIQHPSVGVPQSSGFTITSLQPNFLDCPLMAMPSPLQQSHYL
ncbi:hypothetical protein NC653_007508 [Populus alba x Populus x berolinensis]|uniref:Uncharacterized protein n=1 Tax=Populus alba x Populus x berolinensis TaxID=444605 RepID=A0AAD6RHL1_9ROSI|nr:hypothetical protein NC653_007508 [Populus alba x Populus x berolinensis]